MSSIDASFLVRYVAVVPESLAAALGRRVAELRSSAGSRQEDVVKAARQLGLPWAQSSVVDLERGRRRLSAEELVLLPAVMTEALRRPVSLTDLLAVDAVVDIGRARMSTAAVSALLAGRPAGDIDVMGSEDEAIEAVATARQHLADVIKLGAGDMYEAEGTALVREAGGAERKAARQLGLPLATVAIAAHQRWGRSLTDEREFRLGQASADDARTVQARRGHVTRTLLGELRDFLRARGVLGSAVDGLADGQDDG